MSILIWLILWSRHKGLSINLSFACSLAIFVKHLSINTDCDDLNRQEIALTCIIDQLYLEGLVMRKINCFLYDIVEDRLLISLSDWNLLHVGWQTITLWIIDEKCRQYCSLDTVLCKWCFQRDVPYLYSKWLGFPIQWNISYCHLFDINNIVHWSAINTSFILNKS